jgi:hypothetical protein
VHAAAGRLPDLELVAGVQVIRADVAEPMAAILVPGVP